MRIIIFLFGFYAGFLNASIEEKLITTTLVSAHLEHMARIPQNTDVHVLDGYVSLHLSKLKNIGEGVGFGTSSLSKDDIESKLFDYINNNPGFYGDYEGQKIRDEELKGYISVALQTANSDSNVLALYSLTMSGLLILANVEDISTYMKQFFDIFSENYKTSGGCFQGVRNRIFACYCYFLNSYLYF